jgi:gliding motility-associated-like protein
MKTTKIILLLAFFCCFTTLVNAQYISVDNSKNAEDLVNVLTNNSTCLALLNQKAKGDPTIPINNSFGSFEKGLSNFPFEKGIVLSTGSAKKSEGPFDVVKSIGGLSKWAGDTDLENALGITPTLDATVNATILEFDFTPLTNYISFNFLFASNEYQNKYPCEYSDGFAFLIKDISLGSSPTYANLAIIPGTPIPISSFNIHPAINYIDTYEIVTKCDQKNESYFNGFNTYSSPINYAGQTIPMTAEAAVIPGNNYHIKLVVADSRSKNYNSAVFLEAGSFSSKINISASKSNPVCFGEGVILNANLVATSYQWYKDGNPIPYEPNQTYTVTEAGTYKIEATLSSGCIASGEIKVDFTPEIKINTIPPLSKCDDHGDGTATFDLNNAKTDLLNGNPATTTIEYFETKTPSGLSDIILDPSSFKKIDLPDQTVYAKLTSVYGCKAVAEIKLQTSPSVLNLSIITPMPIIHEFSGEGNSVTLVPPTTPSIYEYSLDGSNYQTSPLFSNLIAGNYKAYIRDSYTCEFSINPFVILDYPHFFTPNEDGINDEWEIKNLDVSYPNASISIFDRYGKLLKQITAGGESWKGTFNGLKLPADDYWFIIDLKNGEITKGHFSLKR